MEKTYKDLNSDIVFKKLLCCGLFPQFVDKIFSSENFGNFIIQNLDNPELQINKGDVFTPLPYKITRNNNAPRYLGIPHPLAYIHLCKCLKDNWDKIDKHIGNDNPEYLRTSMIYPKNNNKKKRLISWESYDRNPAEDYLILNKQIGAKYFVFADISNYFPNIYSHSIPWAAIGKPKAKNNRNSNWFNSIDKALRCIKNGETNGLLIGPDSSNIISEIILSTVDRILTKQKGYKYLRFIDDYKCYSSSKEEADNFIKDLSSELEKYQLSLNTKKTKIIEMPKVITDNWIRELRNFKLPDLITKREYEKVQDLLDLGVELSKKQKDYSPFKYVIKILDGKNYKNYLEFEKLFLYLCSVVYLHPYMIDLFDKLIFKGINTYPSKEENLKTIIKNFFQKLLNEHIDYARSDVIVWTLFLCIKYKIIINNFDNNFSEKILKLNDSLPTLLSFFYSKFNNYSIDKYYNLLINIKQNDEQNEWWLYIYELFYSDDTLVKQKINDLKHEKFYSFLKNNKINFLTF